VILPALVATLAAAAPPSCSPLLPAAIGSAAEDLARIQELTGVAPVRPQLFRRWSNPEGGFVCTGGRAPHPSEVPQVAADPDSFEVRLLPLEWRNYLNSGYPDDRNDGALWEGRGISTGLTGGVRVRWKFFSAGFAPLVAWQQNRDFYRAPMTTPGYSQYANPFNYGAIDLPLRFGPDAFWTLDPGQSFARVDLYNVALGVSTENLWWGPGLRNSILMTNSGPGFPHLFVGTSRPQDIWIGWLEVQLMWGRLTQSDYFLTDPVRTRRVFSALIIGYEPRWIPGLFLGLTRVFVDRLPSRVKGIEYVARLFWNESTGHNGPENQLGSLMLRWVFPDSGLEIFGEWGRDDYSLNLQDFVDQPEHAQAYMFGLQKTFGVPARIRLHAELAHTLEKPTNNPTRPVPIFYAHSDEIHGYTQRGQMIGAGIGPQADSEFLAVDYFHRGGRTGVWIERILHDDRYFYDNVHTFLGQDAELAVGLRGALQWRDLALDWSLAFAHRYRFNFGDDANSLKTLISLSWTPAF